MVTSMRKRPTSALNVETTVAGDLHIRFANGREIAFGTSMLSQEIIGLATLHGLKQKLVDAAAISRDPETGRPATVEDKYLAVKAVADRLLAGQWNANRGEGGGAGSGGLLYRALVRMYPGKTSEEVRSYLDGLGKEKQAALRGNPRVAAIIAEIKAEDEAKKPETKAIDSDDLLAGLEG